jgi:uncharacterized protein
MRTRAVFFPSGDLKLQGYCYYPDKDGVMPGVVLCHPHPLHGGSMSSSVIKAIGQELTEKSIIAFMFNFRGVGKSEGEYDNGIGEQEDVKAAITWLESQTAVEKDKIGLAGYSFGGGMASAVAANNNKVKSLALVSPFIEPPQINCLTNSRIKKYFITGGDDDMIFPGDVEAFFNATAEPKEMEIIQGIDHFWFGSENIVGKKIADFLSGVL